MADITVELPDKSKKKYKKGITLAEIAKSIGSRLAKAALVARVDGNLMDMNDSLEKSAKIEFLTWPDKDAKAAYWHSCSHILADAMMRLWPETQLAIGPSIEEGFYYDVDPGKNLDAEDLEKLEAEIKKIIKEDHKFEHILKTRKEAEKLMSYSKYKMELLKEVPGDKISFHKHGNFIDLCINQVVQSTGQIGVLKLMNVATAYWRGKSDNPVLQRIYGISFPSNKELNGYLKMKEEAEKRDHRRIGKQLELFHTSDEIGPGLILWMPKGNIIKEELEKWGKETEKAWGYQRVTTPIITKEGLFYTSEHLPHYKDTMYAPMDVEGENYYIKPMNCPFHHLIYKSRPRSYRELPLRLAEYGWTHRFEKSGSVMGLMRVRGMQMNDAHIYCTKEQAVDEFVKAIKLHEYYYKILGIKDFWMELSLRDPKSDKYHGDEKMWKEAEKLTKEAMKKSGVKYVIENDGAAFYGPKVDFQIKTAMGKTFSISTNQIDLFMPKKFGLKYIGEDGKEHELVVIHRSPLGTHERFIGFLIEHFAGAFPTWLAPVQVRLIAMADKNVKYAEKVREALEKENLRVETDYEQHTIEYKVRDAQMQKIPYSLVIGDKEEQKATVAVRDRESGKVKYGVKTADFIKQIKKEIETKSN